MKTSWYLFGIITSITLASCGKAGQEKIPSPAGADATENASPLGIFGWDLMQNNVTMEGVVVTHKRYHVGGDNDWILEIRPDPKYEYMLFNKNGKRNEGGTVECEIQPGRPKYDNDAMEQKYFGLFKDKHVRVIGTWVEDKSHDNKTEIHPVTGVLFQDTSRHQIVLIVTSDHSKNFPARVPHSGEDMRLSTELPVPVMNSVRVIEEEGKIRSKSFIVENNTLKINAQTGTPDKGEGFYYCRMQLLGGNTHTHH